MLIPRHTVLYTTLLILLLAVGDNAFAETSPEASNITGWARFIGSGGALAAFVFTAYTWWRSKNQAYYAHLSRVWYDLRKQETDHPCWADPETTSLYENTGTKPLSDYDSHAWSCWALAEDWYETFGKAWWRPGQRRRTYFHNELRQFEGAVRSVVELHWAWLAQGNNACRFDPEFITWVRKHFLEGRIRLAKTPKNTVHAATDICSGQFLGYAEGLAIQTRASDILQIGPSTHISVTSALQYLQHSDTANAWFRGRSLFAITDIKRNEEITINYNCSEESVVRSASTAVGFAEWQRTGKAEEQKQYWHRWIREKQEEEHQISQRRVMLRIAIQRATGSSGDLSSPITPQDVQDAVRNEGLLVQQVTFDETPPIKTAGEHRMTIQLCNRRLACLLVVTKPQQ